MTENLQKKKIEQVKNKVKERLDAIGKLQQEVPALSHAEEELDWMLRAEESAPTITITHPSEKVLHGLDELDSYLTNNMIPISQPDSRFFVSASGTVSSTDYISHVNRIRNQFPNDESIYIWADNVGQEYATLRIKQARTQLANVRLNQLNNRLGDLHNKAVNACLSTSSGVQSPVEGSVTTRELLDGFKGELIRRCKEGKGSTFQRIADNLAFETTKTLIRDQQTVYDDVHHELSEIAKSRITPSQSRVLELLAKVEDHILVVTISINPDKLGFEFTSE